MLKRVFSLLLLAAVLLQLVPVITPKAEAATYTDADWEQLLQNYQVLLSGSDSVDWTDSEIQSIVGKTNSSGFSTSGISYNGGKYWLDLENNRDNSLRIFGTVDITPDVSSSSMGYQFEKLRDMALAYATQGAIYYYKDSNGQKISLPLYQNPALRNAIFYGLEKGHTAFYNYDSYYAWCTSPNAGLNENWYDWATTAPEAILKTLVLLYPAQSEDELVISEAIIAECLAFLNRIRPNNAGKYDTETLANRRSRVRIGPLISLLTKNTTLIEECRTNLEYFTQTDYTTTDGIKPDGSYIYHNCWPLEGMYGTGSLIEVLFVHFAAMDGTAFAFGDAKTLADWILNTFRPVTHKGSILSMNCGRSPQNGNLRGVDLLRGSLQLIGCCDAATDLQMKQFIRSMVCEETEADTRKSYASFAVSLGDVNLVSVLKDIVLESTIADDTREYAAVRYCGDRIVQHQHGYTVGISMSSNRIAIPESINGCNRYGWYAGDGMVYVYNDRTQYNINQYGFEFWRHANMYRLPGITQEDCDLRQPWSNRKPYFPGTTYTYDSATRTETLVKETNEQGQEIASFVGGAELGGKYVAAAMDFESYSWSEEEAAAEKLSIKSSSESNNRKQVLESDLTAKKSYFLFDDEIVCVGSDIDFSTRDTVVNTYVDNRELYKISTVNGKSIRGTEDIVVDGTTLEKVQSFTSPYHYSNPTWVHEQNFGGYYFPNGGEVYVNKTYRESSNDGDDTNDDFNNYLLSTKTPPNAKYSGFELWLSHGRKPTNAVYSYVMLPEKTVAETKVYTQNPDVEIVKCTQGLHVVKEKSLGITAMVFWKAGTYEDITVDAPLILMVQEKDGRYILSASDPTQSLERATIRINKALCASTADAEITVSGGEETILTLDLSQCGGKTVHAEFLLSKQTALMFDFGEDAKYSTSTYGFYNYADASHWATGNLNNTKLTIKNGTLVVPMTTAFDSSGKEIVWTFLEPSDAVGNFAWSSNPNKANILRYDPSEADIFQIRLKLTDVTVTKSGSAGVYLCYLPDGADCWSNHQTIATNPYRETIGANIPDEFADGGSKEGQYITLTVSLKDKKLPTYDLIKGISVSFGNLRGGTATIDYIYIGPEASSLYFGFDNDGATNRYEQSAYGGFHFDRTNSPNWATNLTESVGNHLTIDHADGILSLYTAQDAYGEPGAYLCTTAQSGKYAWSGQQTLHTLSYNPADAEIIEIRFRTDGITTKDGKTPTVVPVLVLENDGTITSDTASSVAFSITDGVFRTVQVPLSSVVRSADYIKSLGLRFVGTKSLDENSVGRIDVDYIYVGTKKDAPSNLYFDFADTKADQERYSTKTYHNRNFDTASDSYWITYANGGSSNYTIDNDSGLMRVKVTDATAGSGTSLTYGPTIKTAATKGSSANVLNALNYEPTNAEYIQIRFKLENCAFDGGGKNAKQPTVELQYGYEKDGETATVYSTNLSYTFSNGKYVIVNFPVDDTFKTAERIGYIALRFKHIKQATTAGGSVDIDYIFVGRESDMPTQHNYKSIVTAPTCTEQGYTTHTCANCGDSYVDTYVDATGHKYGSWTIFNAATCTEKGQERRDCGNCDHYETREVAATGHSYKSVVTAPTCTEQGHTTHTCANCGDSYVDSYVAALGHNYESVTSGYTVTYTCTSCGDTYTENITPDPSLKNGIYLENGLYYYYINDQIQYAAGLVCVNGDYYYIRSGGYAAIGSYWCTNTNGITAEGFYIFAEDGKMILTDTTKTGIYLEDGKFYYYIDGEIQFGAGLVMIDGSYYYIRSGGYAAIGSYWVTNTNGITAEGFYIFANDGKMILTDTSKTGIYLEDGLYYYYVEGEIQFGAGLVLVDGSYYYIRSGGYAATGEYYVSNTNGLLPEGFYTFGEDGKMIL